VTAERQYQPWFQERGGAGGGGGGGGGGKRDDRSGLATAGGEVGLYKFANPVGP
jgi:hypothetical protein